MNVPVTRWWMGRCSTAHPGVAHGTVDLTAALQKSCNGYFIQLGQQLGAERVRDMAAAMGFGSAVPLAGALEADAGRLPAAAELHSSGQFANFCFGQGTLMAAPVQVAAMMNTIAAGGVYRSPCFVECAVDEVTGPGAAAACSSHSPPGAVGTKCAKADRDAGGSGGGGHRAGGGTRPEHGRR